jgi:hypothetical protein
LGKAQGRKQQNGGKPKWSGERHRNIACSLF